MQGWLQLLLSLHFLSLLVHGSCLCLQPTPVLGQLLPESQPTLLPSKGRKGWLKQSLPFPQCADNLSLVPSRVPGSRNKLSSSDFLCPKTLSDSLMPLSTQVCCSWQQWPPYFSLPVILYRHRSHCSCICSALASALSTQGARYPWRWCLPTFSGIRQTRVFSPALWEWGTELVAGSIGWNFSAFN